MRDLRGKHRQPPALTPAAQGGEHLAVLPARQTADAEALQHQCAVVRGQQRDDVRPHARHKPQHKNGGLKPFIEPHGRLVRGAAQKRHQPRIAEHRGLGVVDAGKRIEAARPRLARACAQNDLIVKHKLHAPRAVADRVDERAVEIVARVGIAVVDGLLAAGQHNGLRAVLHHVAERRGGVGHRVCAVGDDKTVAGIIIFFDAAHNALPLRRADVRRIQVEHLHSADLAQVSQLGHAGQQLL